MKLIRVKCRDVEVGNISVGLAENGKGVEISEGNLFYWDEKAGNITVNGKMYTYYIIRGRRKSKFGFNGGKILGITMTNHYKDPANKLYFSYGYGNSKGFAGVSLPNDFYKTTAKWFVKPSTPEAKAAFDALVKKYN